MRTRSVVAGVCAVVTLGAVIGSRVLFAAPAIVSADVNQDGCVDLLDLDEIDLWSSEPTSATHPITGRLDLNRDGIVDGADADLAFEQYGNCL